MPKSRPPYPPAFRRRMVELVRTGRAPEEVARVVRQTGLAGVSRRKGLRTARRDCEARPAPDRVKREFHAEAPDRLCGADVPYVPTRAEFPYLVSSSTGSAAESWAGRWPGTCDLRTELVLDTLDMAVQQRRAGSVIHYCDQGCQYTSFALGECGWRWRVVPSMGSVGGDGFGNATAESFFATLELRTARPHVLPEPSPSAQSTPRVHRGMV